VIFDQLDFALKDLGNLHHFLGIQVTRSKQELTLSQKHYAKEVLQRAGMHKCKPVKTPLVTSEKLSVGNGTSLGEEESNKYINIVGGLQYLTLTQPDISFVVNCVRQFLHSPTDLHMEVVKRILRYVQGTLDMRLHFCKSSLTPRAFSEADWVVCYNDRWSTSGFAVYLGANLVSWSSRKQQIVS
jgi:hypothetical protein